ncbi:MAG: UbiA family prenyltransferase [Candidatus Heimdallarchaeota archaeon]|nr:UbiA family prenyltransferase [Candidatus Heimdallarchaeota archaeon]MCK5047993.1 UbiA family prenyltransferase [Candidatus Heimdallarchaeota archaeon]
MAIKAHNNVTYLTNQSIKSRISGFYLLMRDGIIVSLLIASLTLIVHSKNLQWDYFPTFLTLSFGVYGLYALNDLYDVEIDASNINKKNRNPITSGKLTPKDVKAVIVFSTFGMCFLSYLINFYLLFFVIFFWILGASYSMPPVRLKSRPGLDLLTHSLLVLTFPYFFTLLALNFPITRADIIMISILAGASMVSQLNHQHNDREFDSLYENNLAIFLGPHISLVTIFSIAILTILLTFTSFALNLIPFHLFPIAIFFTFPLLSTVIQNYHFQLWTIRLSMILGLTYLAIILI